MTKSNIGIFWSAAAFILIASFAAPNAHAQPAAMVTDVTGGVTIQGGPMKGAITILSEIDVGTRLQLAATAKLVVLYLKSGDE